MEDFQTAQKTDDIMLSGVFGLYSSLFIKTKSASSMQMHLFSLSLSQDAFLYIRTINGRSIQIWLST